MSEVQTIEEDLVNEKINPWLTIWYRPRETFRYLINNDFNLYYYFLIIAYGFIRVMDQAVEKDYSQIFDMDIDTIWWFVFIVSPIVGLVNVYVFGIGFGASAEWFGGVTNFNYARRLFVWSSIPYIIVGLIMFLLSFSVVGSELLTGADLGFSGLWILALGIPLGVIAFIYRFVLFYIGYKEIYQFSSHWRVIGASIVGFLVAATPGLCLYFLLLGGL